MQLLPKKIKITIYGVGNGLAQAYNHTRSCLSQQTRQSHLGQVGNRRFRLLALVTNQWECGYQKDSQLTSKLYPFWRIVGSNLPY